MNRDPPAWSFARRKPPALSLIEAIHPQRLTGLGIYGNNGTIRTRRGVKHTIRHERRDLIVGPWRRAKVIGLPAPGHLKL